MTTVTLPTIQQPFVDEERRINYLWLDKLKFIERLQPLSDIDNATLEASVALKSNILRSYNNQTGTTYTFVLGDSGKYCRFTNASAVTVTVPPHSSVAFEAGTQIDLVQGGAGKVTFAPGSGVTINSFNSNKALAGRYAGAMLVRDESSSDVWDLVGNLIA